MTTPHETEIKLDIDEQRADTLRARLPTCLGLPAHTRSLVSVYFDTADQSLRKGGVALRIRVAGDSRLQTVKAADVDGGLFRRSEWETEVGGETPDLQALKATPAHDLIAGHPLAALFETRIERTTWLVEHEGAQVEVALDDGAVVAGLRTAPILELELELKSGAPSALFSLLQKIDDGTALRLGVQAKSERGYALLRKRRRACKAEAVALEADMTTAAAFQAVMRSCIRQFRLNEPLVERTREAEALHQARVGMRRLRSALSLFGPIVADPTLARLAAGLKEASAPLGAARDLDVYLQRAAGPEAAADAHEPGVAAYLAALRARREAAYDTLLAMLAGAPFRRLMLDLMAWVEAGPWLVSDDPLQRARRERPFRAVAADMLAERRRKVVERGRHLDRLNPDARHRVRIAAKKLRYAADFVTALPAPGKEQARHATFTEALEALQAVLGTLNDIRTGHAVALGYAHEDPAVPAALFAAGHVSGRQNEQVEPLLHAAVKAHRALKDARPFWLRWSKGAS